MEFRTSNCAIITVKGGIISRSEGMWLPNAEVIKNIEDGEGNS